MGLLALFTNGKQYHDQIAYCIPTAKGTRTQPSTEQGFAGLVETLGMTQPASIDIVNLCEALAVVDPTTGNLLEQQQLRKDPRYKATWDTLYAKGQLCQGVGTGTLPSKQHIEDTNTFCRTAYLDIPEHKRKEICHTKVVCEVRPNKADPNHTQITIGGNRI